MKTVTVVSIVVAVLATAAFVVIAYLARPRGWPITPGSLKARKVEIDGTPFTRIVVNNQWPVLYPLAAITRGNYRVVYNSSDGEQIAGSCMVP